MKSYLELKIVTTDLAELERLIREYDGNGYWTFLKINNGLADG